MHLHGFTVEGLWQTRSMVSGEIVGWLMLDLARQQLVVNLRHYYVTCRNASITTAGGTLLNLVLRDINYYYIFGSI